MIKDAVIASANNWFKTTCELKSQKPLVLVTQQELEENKLQHIIECLQLVRGYIHRSTEFFDKIFLEYLNIRYSSFLYEAFDAKLAGVIKHNIEDVTEHLEKLDFNPSMKIKEFEDKTQVTMTTTIFEIYSLVQTFLETGRALAPENKDSFKLNCFYLWFTDGIKYWMDLATLKTFILSSVILEKDNFKPLGSNHLFSDGCVLLLKMFYEVKEFWDVLEWPVMDEAGLSIKIKMIHNISSCFSFYCYNLIGIKNEIVKNVSTQDEASAVIEKLCVIVNNIEHVFQKSIELIEQICQKDSLEGLDLVTLNNTIEHRKNQISSLTQSYVNTIHYDLVKISVHHVMECFVQGTCSIDKGARAITEMINFQKSFVKMLFSRLTNAEENVNAIMSLLKLAVYKKILQYACDSSEDIEDVLEKNGRQPLSYFQNAQLMTKLLLEYWSFYQPETEEKLEVNYKNLLETLELCGAESDGIIHRYCTERQIIQSGMSSALFGALNVVSDIKDNVLKVSFNYTIFITLQICFDLN